MTKIPKEPMPSTNRDDRQRDSVPSPFTFVNEPFDSDSDTETEDSGNWPGESLDAALDAALESVSKAASNWIKKARGSVSMKRVMKMMRDR
jgi:hypothetical protein